MLLLVMLLRPPALRMAILNLPTSTGIASNENSSSSSQIVMITFRRLVHLIWEISEVLEIVISTMYTPLVYCIARSYCVIYLLILGDLHVMSVILEYLSEILASIHLSLWFS